MKKIFELIFAALTFSFGFLEGLTPFLECNNVVSPYVKDAERRGLVLFLSGGGGINEVRTVDLGFDAYGPVSVSEARTILIREVAELINRLNSHRELRPLMHQYPLTPADITYSISFVDRTTGRPCSKGIEMIMSNKGRIKYFDENKGLSRKPPILVETWEEAVALAGQPGP